MSTHVHTCVTGGKDVALYKWWLEQHDQPDALVRPWAFELFSFGFKIRFFGFLG